MTTSAEESEPLDAMEEQQKFLREFISTYKSCPMLWDPADPNYRNRSVRKQAYDQLFAKCKEYNRDCNEDYVKSRIDSMRSSFRREYAKIQTRDNYRPTLWYFNLLTFLAGNYDENDKLSEICNPKIPEIPVKMGFWTREYSALLIDIFKKYKCVYMPKYTIHRYRHMREQAHQNITQELMTITKKKFKVADIRKKIQMLRGQFRLEYCKVKMSEARGDQPPYKSSLWCYNLLMFLSNTVVKSRKISRKESFAALRKRLSNKRESREYSDDEDEKFKRELDHQSEEDRSPSPDRLESETNGYEENLELDDIHDAIAKNVAHKLRNMTDEQNKIAQRILNDLMYYGQMEELSPKSRLSLDGL